MAQREFRVPDIGEFEDVEVIEVLVAVGDGVAVEQSLVTLESDKATMELPAPFAGVVAALHVAVGDKVSEGSPIATLEVGDEAGAGADPAPRQVETEPEPPALVSAAASAARAAMTKFRGEAPAVAEPAPAAPAPPQPPAEAKTARAHASPSVRRLARELGVDLARVAGTGRKQRILKEDVQEYVKAALAAGAAPRADALHLPEAPRIDFSQFGEIEVQPLNRVRRSSGRQVHRSWLAIPHVTQFDEADITDLEEFRRSKADEARERGARLTLLAFLMKAVEVTLGDFPHFNASLDPDGESLILKKYMNMGVAVDTQHGLVVPVIRDVDSKGLFELAEELAESSQKARDRKLRPEDLAGGCFTISSLGGIGGTAFTPIINHPEVAILGVSRSQTKPVYRDDQFVPRLMLPLSLSYDHRVIDGADAVRFTTRLKVVLSDIRNLIL